MTQSKYVDITENNIHCNVCNETFKENSEEIYFCPTHIDSNCSWNQDQTWANATCILHMYKYIYNIISSNYQQDLNILTQIDQCSMLA